MDELRAERVARLAGQIDEHHARIGAEQSALLRRVAEYDRHELWKADGCRDMAEWLAARLGIMTWAGRRWVVAAHALVSLPLLSDALETGVLCLDKVAELARFATPDTERDLIRWGRRVTAATIRHRADLAQRASLDETQQAERERYLRWWWFDDGRRLWMEGQFPAAQGTAIVKALKSVADSIPSSPEDADAPIRRFAEEMDLERRCADALHALAMTSIAEDADVDRATVVVHTTLMSTGDVISSEVEGGPVLHPEIARRLACDARLEFVLTDADGNALGIGRRSRSVPPWLMRQLRHRDRGCTFPGCGRRSFLQAHHIWHWDDGGPTDLDNLTLLCHFHHKLVHEFGWKVCLESGLTKWSRPDGRPFDPGRSPPAEAASDFAYAS
ncbi:MAG: DUF222 domain-containing protein [Actinomycetota bacterium]